MRHWPASERPRERLLSLGPRVLSDSELLALIVGGSAPGGGGAVDLCRGLLGRFGGLAGLGRRGPAELMQVAGIGEARACALTAMVELGRRLATAGWQRRTQLTRSEHVYSCVRRHLVDLRQEVFVVLALDARNRLLRITRVAQGSATAVEVHPREVFAPLVREGAVGSVVAHNHPSGDPEPSPDDVTLTERLSRAGIILGIPLLDHLVIGDEGYVSFADRGLL